MAVVFCCQTHYWSVWVALSAFSRGGWSVECVLDFQALKVGSLQVLRSPL